MDTIGLTSKGSAAARAYESQRQNALFIDPFASVYARYNDDQTDENVNQCEERGRVINRADIPCFPKLLCRTTIANMVLRSVSSSVGRLSRFSVINGKKIFEDVAVRTHFLDKIIEENIANIKQIVLLACGGDYRPYRLSFLQSICPSNELTFYLFDSPNVLSFRQKCLAQFDKCSIAPWKIVEIGCDLSSEGWSQRLYETGFDTKQTTLWMAEGFFEYLTDQQVKSMFNQIQQLSMSEKTSIVFDLISTRFQNKFRHAIPGGLFHFALDDENEICRFFSELGCSNIKCTSFHEIGRTYGRTVTNDRSFIVTAQISSTKVV